MNRFIRSVGVLIVAIGLASGLPLAAQDHGDHLDASSEHTAVQGSEESHEHEGHEHEGHEHEGHEHEGHEHEGHEHEGSRASRATSMRATSMRATSTRNS